MLGNSNSGTGFGQVYDYEVLGRFGHGSFLGFWFPVWANPLARTNNMGNLYDGVHERFMRVSLNKGSPKT